MQFRVFRFLSRPAVFILTKVEREDSDILSCCPRQSACAVVPHMAFLESSCCKSDAYLR